MLGNIRLLIQLRWAAMGLQLLVGVVAFVLHLPVDIRLFVFGLGLQLLVNVFTYARLQELVLFSDRYVFYQLAFDLVALVIFMVACGGLANPFSGLFLVQAVLAAILLSGYRLWLMVLLTGGGYAILLGWHPTRMHEHHWMSYHLYGMILNHAVTTVIIGYFVFRVVRNLKNREQQLAARQGIVGIGAAAAQIAHKMGTPLHTIMLLTEDLSPETVVEYRPMLLQEVSRCRTYFQSFFSRVKGVNHEGDPVFLTDTLLRFRGWFTSRYPHLGYAHGVSAEIVLQPMSSELVSVLLELLLDNAVEAQASQVGISVERQGHCIQICVENNGRPLPDTLETMMRLGYSGDTHHTGMGLFLVKLILETLQGTIAIMPPKNQSMTVAFCVRLPLDHMCEPWR